MADVRATSLIVEAMVTEDDAQRATSLIVEAMVTEDDAQRATSLIVEAMVPDLDISQPTGLSATAAGSDQIDLAWTDNADNETGYLVERSPDDSTWVTIDTLAADSTSYSDTGLDPATEYFYRVIATNGASQSDPSASDSATTDPEVPEAPTNPAATAISASRIDVTWTDVDNETGYRVERSDDGVSGWVDVSGSLAADSTSYSDTGLTADTEYFYRIIATNAAGDSVPSSVVNATTQAGGGGGTGNRIGGTGAIRKPPRI